MKKIILSIAVLALALSSCEDFLTKEPPMDQSDELALSTFEGIDGATAGNYRAVVWGIVPVDIRRDVRQRYGRPGQYRTYAYGTGMELYFDQHDGSLVERI